MDVKLIIEIQKKFIKIQEYLKLNEKEISSLLNVNGKKAIIGIKFNKIDLTEEKKAKILHCLNKLKKKNLFNINNTIIDEDLIIVAFEEKI